MRSVGEVVEYLDHFGQFLNGRQCRDFEGGLVYIGYAPVVGARVGAPMRAILGLCQAITGFALAILRSFQSAFEKDDEKAEELRGKIKIASSLMRNGIGNGLRAVVEGSYWMLRNVEDTGAPWLWGPAICFVYDRIKEE